MILLDSVRSPRYDANHDSRRGPGPDQPCLLCGLRIRAKYPPMVRLHAGGLQIVTPEEAEKLDPDADLGLHAIGADCLRKHPELESYVLRERPGRSPRSRRVQRFIDSRCDRCGKATPARINDGELFVLAHELGHPIADQGSFCLDCCSRYTRDEWITWFQIHRPERLKATCEGNHDDDSTSNTTQIS